MKNFKLIIIMLINLLLLNINIIFSQEEKILNEWIKIMKYGISSQRSGVIKSIEDKKFTNAYFLIENALTNDENDNIRAQAAFSLLNLKVSNENLWNAAITNEKKNDVLRKIVYSASSLKINSSGKFIYQILQDKITNTKDNQLIGVMIRALGELKYKEANQFVLSILTNSEYSQDIRSASALAIGEIGDFETIKILENIIKNPGELKEIRMYCAYAIGKTGNKEAIDILVPIIEDEKEDLNVRLYALAGLGFIKDSQDLFKKILLFARMDNTRIRLEAVKVLGKMNITNDDIIDLLKFKALYDPEMIVRKESKTSLQNLGIDLDSLNKSETNKTVADITTNTNITSTTTNK